MPQWPNGLHGLVGENIISEKKKKRRKIPNEREDKKLRWKKKKNRPFEYSKFNEKIIEVGA